MTERLKIFSLAGSAYVMRMILIGKVTEMKISELTCVFMPDMLLDNPSVEIGQFR